MKTVIENATVVDPFSAFQKRSNLYIDGKKFAGIGQHAPEGFKAKQIINAEGKMLFPGLVDLAAYLREPGQEFKASIESECLAAVSAGITRLCFMPEPATAIDSMPMVNLIRKRAKATKKAHVEVIGSITVGLNGEQLSNMGGLKYAGVVGVSNQRQPFNNSRTLRLAMEYAATFNLTVFIHPIDHALVGRGCAHEGPVATRMGLPGIPVAAETTALAQILALVEELDVRVHICRLSAGNSVELISQAKEKGLPVTADVAAHQLFLTEMDVSDFNPLCHVQPPLRSQRDRDRLRKAVSDGIIDAICSDHQPHDIDAKLAPFQQTQPGISSLETLLPLCMRLVEEGVLTLQQALGAVTYRPAEVIKQKESGKIVEGAQADFVLYDPDMLCEIRADKLVSRGSNTPFDGWSFNGRVTDTFIKGKSVFSLAS